MLLHPHLRLLSAVVAGMAEEAAVEASTAAVVADFMAVVVTAGAARAHTAGALRAATAAVQMVVIVAALRT